MIDSIEKINARLTLICDFVSHQNYQRSLKADAIRPLSSQISLNIAHANQLATNQAIIMNPEVREAQPGKDSELGNRGLLGGREGGSLTETEDAGVSSSFVHPQQQPEATLTSRQHKEYDPCQIASFRDTVTVSNQGVPPVEDEHMGSP